MVHLPACGKAREASRQDRQAEWVRQDQVRRRERAEASAQALIARLDDLYIDATTPDAQHQRNIDHDVIRPYYLEIQRRAEEFENPTRERISRLAQAMYLWTERMASEAHMDEVTVVEEVARASRTVLGAYLRGEPLPEPDHDEQKIMTTFYAVVSMYQAGYRAETLAERGEASPDDRP